MQSTFPPFAQQTGLSVHGPGISPRWRRCRRTRGPSGTASGHRGLSYLEGKNKHSLSAVWKEESNRVNSQEAPALLAHLGSQVWPDRASGRVNLGRATARCPSSPSSHTAPRRNTPAQTWTGRRRHLCPCSGTSTQYCRDRRGNTNTQFNACEWCDIWIEITQNQMRLRYLVGFFLSSSDMRNHTNSA